MGGCLSILVTKVCATPAIAVTTRCVRRLYQACLLVTIGHKNKKSIVHIHFLTTSHVVIVVLRIAQLLLLFFLFFLFSFKFFLIMVVIRGFLRERQFISAPIKIICPRRSRWLMIILPARRSRARVKCFAHERSECRQGIYWH